MCNEAPPHRRRYRVRPLFRIALLSAPGLVGACVTVPPEVARTQTMELQIVESLQSSHIAMVDAFIDAKLANFETFVFDEYGPVYRANWMEGFAAAYNRPYVPEQDFSLFYNDLVAEYLELAAPIEAVRIELKDAIDEQYRNARSAHLAVAAWIDSVEKLNNAQRAAINDLLGTVQPTLSLESIDERVQEAMDAVRTKIGALTGEP